MSKKTILFFIIFLFFFNFLLRINDSHDPFYDDYFYHDIVQFYHEKNKTGDFWSYYVFSEKTNLPALYMYLMVPFYEQGYKFFLYAKYINFLTGILMIFAVYWAGKKLFDESVGLISAFLISVNPIILERSAILASENLLVLFSVIALVFFSLGFKKNSLWIVAFIFSFLAYLSKLNGIFIIPSFMIAIFLTTFFYWKKLDHKKRYLSFILIISVTVLVFLPNIYSLISSQTSYLILFKNRQIDTTEMFGLQQYSTYKNLLELLKEEPFGLLKNNIWGFTRELHRFTVGLFVSIEWSYKDIFSINLGYIALPFFIYLLSKEKDPHKRIFYITFIIVVFLGNIPRASANHGSARYSITVTPLFFFFLSPIISNIAQKIKARWNLSKQLQIVIVFFLALGLNSIVFSNSFRQFSLFPKFSNEYQQSLDWLKKNLPKGARLGIESNSKLKFRWYLTGDIYEEIIASTKNGKYYSQKQLGEYFKKKNIQYIIIDLEAKSPYNRNEKKFFFKNVIIDKTGKLSLDKLKNDYEVVFKDAEQPKRIIILKVKATINHLKQ